MAAVVVLGTAGIVSSRDQRQPDNTRPFAAAPGRAADHWHTAIGFHMCGAFAPNLPEGNDPLGIHGHGDNVVHIHPFGATSSGKRATLGIYFDSVGADMSDDKIELPGQGTKRNGDSCEDGKGVIRTKVWDTRDPADQGRIVEGDPSSIRPQDGQLITIAFGKADADIPRPPSAPTLDNLSDVGPRATAPTTTTVDPTASSTSSTVANDPNVTTTTTAGDTTTTTVASPTTSTSRP
jgi:hypothetical protein